MVKHRLRESMKSLFRSHIDPEKEELLKGAKREIQDKVKRILKLVKDEHLEEDGTPSELSKKESLVKLIEDFHNQYQSLYAKYDHLTDELRKKIIGKREQEQEKFSSSSDSDSDYSSTNKGSKNGQLENEFQKIINGMKQELEMAHMEVAELNRKLTNTCEEKEDLNSKYLAALSKIQAADKINIDLKIDVEALGTQRSKLLAENVELNKQLAIAGKMEAELNKRLEDLKREKDNLILEKETAFLQIDEEQKITNSLRIMPDQQKDEKIAVEKELEAVTRELSVLKQQLEHAEQQMTNASHNLKVVEEENESLKMKLSQVSNEVQLADNRIGELVAESNQLKEKLHDREREAAALTQMHEEYESESSNQIKALEFQVTNLELELKSLQSLERDMEEKLKSSTTETRELKEHNSGLQDQISELERKFNETEQELSALMKKLDNNENEVSSKMADLTSQINDLLTDIGKLHAQKNEMEEEMFFQGNEASAQVKSLTDQINVLQEDMQSLQHQKSDLEVQLEEKDLENSGYMIQIQTLKEEVDSITLEQKRLKEDKENSIMQIRNLELEMNEASAQIMAFRAQVDNLQKNLLSLQKEKEELILHCERVKEAHAESLVILENERNELASKTLDHNRILEEREYAYQKLNEEYKQTDKECKVKLEVADKKIQEMTEEFHKGIGPKDQMIADLEQTAEDLKRDLEEKGDEIDTLHENVRMLEVKLRLSNQKFRVTEQLLSEQEESFRESEEKFQKDQRSLENRIATLSATIAAKDKAYQEIMTDIKESVNSVITGIENIVRKFSEEYKNYANCFSNISHELQIAKNYVREMNKEKERLKKDVHHLVEQLQDKKEEELALRQMIEKLEGKASKEELAKKNLMTTVVQLQKTIGELEQLMKEKDEGILDMGEEKREAIRQLCLGIDYHRSRYDHLKGVLSMTRRDQSQRAT